MWPLPAELFDYGDDLPIIDMIAGWGGSWALRGIGIGHDGGGRKEGKNEELEKGGILAGRREGHRRRE